jgi:hypothetical protein
MYSITIFMNNINNGQTVYFLICAFYSIPDAIVISFTLIIVIAVYPFLLSLLPNYKVVFKEDNLQNIVCIGFTADYEFAGTVSANCLYGFREGGIVNSYLLLYGCPLWCLIEWVKHQQHLFQKGDGK